MLRYLAMLLLSGAIALLTAAAQAETLNARLVLSDGSPPYQKFSAALYKALAASKADVTIIESQIGSGANTDLVIAVGMKATESALTHPSTPVLGVMVTQMGYATLVKKLPSQQRPRTVSAIYIDQPWERQLDFIRAALPKHRRIGLLY